MSDDIYRYLRGILSEQIQEEPDIYSHLQVIFNVLDRIKPSSLKDKRNLDAIKQHLYDIKRNVRKLEEQVKTLQEENIVPETK